VGSSYSFVAGGHSTNTAALCCISRYGGQVDGVRMNSNTRQRNFLCRELMSTRFEEKFVEDSAGDGLLPIADICEEFGRAERNIDTRQHWKKRTAFQVYIYIFVLVPCTRQLLLMCLSACAAFFAPSLRFGMRASRRASLCGSSP